MKRFSLGVILALACVPSVPAQMRVSYNPSATFTLEAANIVPRLAEPVPVRLQAGSPVRSIAITQKQDGWAHTSRPDIADLGNGWKGITVVPRRLGDVDVSVSALLANGLIVERGMRLHVELPEQSPVSFHGTQNDLLLLGRGGKASLTPVARFRGLDQDVPLAPGDVQYQVVTDAYDVSPPPISVDSDGTVHAVSRGTARVKATFMGVTSVSTVRILPALGK